MMRLGLLLSFMMLGTVQVQAIKGFYRARPAHVRHSPPASQTHPATNSPPTTTAAPAPDLTAAQNATVQPVVRYTPRITPPYPSHSSTNALSGDSENKPIEPPHITAPVVDPILEYQKADAEKGFPEAQFALGVRYLTGNGVPQDEARGKELVKLAAHQGSERARDKIRELRAAGKL